MHRNGLRPTPPAIALAALLLVVPALDAQPAGGSYVLRKQAIGAGGESSAGPYRLTGTVAEGGGIGGAALSTGRRFPRPEGPLRSDRRFDLLRRLRRPCLPLIPSGRRTGPP